MTSKRNLFYFLELKIRYRWFTIHSKDSQNGIGKMGTTQVCVAMRYSYVACGRSFFVGYSKLKLFIQKEES